MFICFFAYLYICIFVYLYINLLVSSSNKWLVASAALPCINDPAVWLQCSAPIDAENSPAENFFTIPLQCQCNTSAMPVQGHCNTNTKQVQYQCNVSLAECSLIQCRPVVQGAVLRIIPVECKMQCSMHCMQQNPSGGDNADFPYISFVLAKLLKVDQPLL